MVSHSMRAFADFCCSVAIAIDDILKIKQISNCTCSS